MNRWLSSITLLLAVFCQFTFAAPALYKIEKNGHQSYLLGTIHVGDNSMANLPNNIISALSASQQLVVEVDIDAMSQFEMQKIVMKYGMLQGNNTLQSVLDASNYQWLKTYFNNKKIDISLFNKYKPWLVSLTIMMMEYQNAGFSEEYGIDKQLLKLAGTQSKSIYSLESIEFQMQLFDKVGMDNNQYMSDMRDEMSRVNTDIPELVTAWKNGDIKALDDVRHKSFGNTPFEQRMQKLMLSDRNQNWVKQLTPMLAQKDLFIAVGALHLVGEQGLITLLQQQGFTLQKLN